MTRGKVVLVPFPFDDLSASKVRPAVCLTDPIGPYRHVVMAFISSEVPPVLHATDMLLDPADAEFTATGLRVASVLRLHRMTTLTSRIIVRELGELPARFQTQAAEKLVKLFRLDAAIHKSAGEHESKA